MANVMSFPTRIVHGRGATNEIPAELQRAGASKVLIVTDRGIVAAGLLRFITPALEQAGLRYSVFAEVDPNPRRLMPCDEGFATSELERRNSSTPGSMRSWPSMVTEAAVCNSV